SLAPVPSSSLSALFSFYAAGVHPHLHSFPTRRSSDLRLPIFDIAQQLALALLVVSLVGSAAAYVLAGTLNFNKRGGISVARRARSEEHTSELQSQSNLVCRLLLEKKKEGSDSGTAAGL